MDLARRVPTARHPVAIAKPQTAFGNDKRGRTSKQTRQITGLVGVPQIVSHALGGDGSALFCHTGFAEDRLDAVTQAAPARVRIIG